MAKLVTLEWEKIRAERYAELLRTVTTEGATGGEEIAPQMPVAQYPSATVDPKVRAAAYSMYRALEMQPPWENLSIIPPWVPVIGMRAPQWRFTATKEVELRGAVTGGVLGTPIAFFPVEARPLATMTFLVPASGGALTAQLTISPAGALTYFALGAAAAATFLALDAVRWHPS